MLQMPQFVVMHRISRKCLPPYVHYHTLTIRNCTLMKALGRRLKVLVNKRQKNRPTNGQTTLMITCAVLRDRITVREPLDKSFML